MSPAPRDAYGRISDYVTGEMPSAEAERMEADMKADPALASAVAECLAMLSEIDETAARLDPSSTLWARIEAALPPASWGRRAAPRARPQLWESLGFWRWTAAATAAAVVVLAAALTYTLSAFGTEPVYVAVLVADNSASPGAIVEIDERGEAWLVPLQEIEVPEGRALQVWTLQDRETGPVSIGLIPDARRLRLNIGALPPTGPDQLFEITLEPETGSPTGRPTGPILFKGTTARAL